MQHHDGGLGGASRGRSGVARSTRSPSTRRATAHLGVCWDGHRIGCMRLGERTVAWRSELSADFPAEMWPRLSGMSGREATEDDV